MSNPNRMLDFGSRVQRADELPLVGSLYLAIENTLHGANSPSYLRARWERAEELVDENGRITEMPLAEADPSPNRFSNLIQRRKKEAVVVGAGMTAMRTLFDDYPEGAAAVAFTYRDITRAGRLPAGPLDYGIVEGRYSAALRVGAEDFRVSPAIWLPGEKTVVAPSEAIILRQHVSIDDLRSQFPNTPLL